MTLKNETMVMLTPDPGKLLYADGVYSNRVFLGVQDTADRWVEVDIPAWWDADRGRAIEPVPALEDRVTALEEAAVNLEQTVDTMLTGGDA